MAAALSVLGSRDKFTNPGAADVLSKFSQAVRHAILDVGLHGMSALTLSSEFLKVLAEDLPINSVENFLFADSVFNEDASAKGTGVLCHSSGLPEWTTVMLVVIFNLHQIATFVGGLRVDQS